MEIFNLMYFVTFDHIFLSALLAQQPQIRSEPAKLQGLLDV